MKGVLLAVVFLLAIIINACGVGNTPIPPGIGTAVAQTQTASMWTPSVTPTINPNSPRILELLNEEFLSDDLETTLNARYEAVDVWFSNFSSGLPPMFHLKIRCECPINGHCCVPEYMFVLTIRAIKNRADELIPQVPYDVIQLNVECYHGLELLDMFFVSWSDVNAYIENSIDGHMLGMRVMSTPFTTP